MDLWPDNNSDMLVHSFLNLVIKRINWYEVEQPIARRISINSANVLVANTTTHINSEACIEMFGNN